MGITEVTVPKQYVLVQATEPTGAFEGQLWYDSTNDLTYIFQDGDWKLISIDVSQDLLNIITENAEQQLEIIELQANASITPIDHDTLISDTFSDTTGYRNTVNLANTTAYFSVGKYTITSGDLTDYDLLAYYKCDETSGTTLEDEIGSADGTHTTSAITNQTGILNKAITFSGSNRTAIPHASMNIVGAISFSFWLKKDSGASDFIISKISVNGNVQYTISVDSSNKIKFVIGSSGGDVTVTSDTAHSTSDWTHVVCTWDGTTNANGIKIYINGTLDKQGQFAGTQETNTNATEFGQNSIAGGSLTTAFTLDEIGIWDKAITQQTINFFYRNGTPPEYNTSTYEEKLLEIDLPTITGTVTHYQLVANTTIETGASVTFKLNDGTTDTDAQDLDEKITYALDDNPEKIKIYLTPKETDPSQGNPSIKTYCLKLWKA